MTELSDFYQALLEFVTSYEQEKKITLRIQQDEESDIIRILGQGSSSVSKAKNGLEDVAELAYTAAEHHPYWGLIYHCSQVSKTALEKWDGDLTPDELDEINWSIKELKNVCQKLRLRMEEEADEGQRKINKH